MTAWKKRWMQELDEKIPALSEEVKNAPIYTGSTEEPEKKPFSLRAWIAEHRRQFRGIVASATAAVVTLAIALPILLLPTPGTPPPVENTASVMLLEINPKAVFSVDKNGFVADVVALNQDADVILSDASRTEEMEGKTAEKAIEVFVDYAAKLGYLNLNTQSAIRVTEYENATAGVHVASIGNALETYFKTMGAQIVVVQDTLSGDEFCQRAGIENSQQGTDGVVQSLAMLSPLYSEREAVQTNPSDEGEWKDLYDQKITADDVWNWISSWVENGFNAEDIWALFNSPTSLEEYMTKMQVYFAGRFEELQAEYKNIYEDTREEISDSDYQAYLDGLVEEYGSLSAYWESLQK